MGTETPRADTVASDLEKVGPPPPPNASKDRAKLSGDGDGVPSQLRLVITGSVDDGKSTLVGRLLHDTKSILADTFDAMVAASASRGAEQVDLALLTDGLRAEREQGITIDVAYRYFSTPRRTFVLADTPGHVQYTRNMVTGASTADAAVILVDARAGIVEQTRRHAALIALLRVPHVIFCVNKMDMINWDTVRFDEVVHQITELSGRLDLNDVRIVPLSALTGQGVVTSAPPAFEQTPLLQFLEELPSANERAVEAFRMPVQLVIRPRTAGYPDYRGLAGRIASGRVRIGDVVRSSLTSFTSSVMAIDTPRGPAESAAAGESITLRLTDELDVARGDVLSLAADTDQPDVANDLLGVVAWLAERPSTPRQRLLLKVGTRTVRAVLTDVSAKWGLEDSRWIAASDDRLELNSIAQVGFHLAEPVASDAYAHHRGTGAFLVIDPETGATLAGGMVGPTLGAMR